jgi:hypothetical protein
MVINAKKVRIWKENYMPMQAHKIPIYINNGQTHHSPHQSLMIEMENSIFTKMIGENVTA